MTLDQIQPETVIREAVRFKDLLESPVYALMIGLVERQHYEEFRAAATERDLVTAQCKAKVLDDVIGALRHVIATGEHDAIERQRKERLAEINRAPISEDMTI